MKTKKTTLKKPSKTGDTSPTQSPASPQCVRWADLDKWEQTSVVCGLFTKGKKFSEIAQTINQIYHANLKRESTYPILLNAIRHKWIRYVPPLERTLEGQLKEKYPWLDGAYIVHSSQFKDVAYYGAETLITLLKRFRYQNRDEVHIGFAGGHAMRKLATIFSELLPQHEGKIPSRLVLHALVAGFDVYEPTTDPNTFFSLFQTGYPQGVEFKFVGLHTPPLVETIEYAKIVNMEGIKESYQEAKKIDIIVTSATSWSDEHSTFQKYMQKSENCFNILKSQKCVGDMLWLPLGEENLIEVQTEIRAMTLFELNQLPGFIQKGKNVLLILGPCGQCNQTKAHVLKAILNQKKHLITHLVADSRSVRMALS